MKHLEKILRKYYTPPQTFDAEPINREMLRAELANLQRHLRTMSWLSSGMILIIFVFETSLAIVYVKQPLVLSGIAAATGITIAGAIARMRELAWEAAEVGLLIALAGELDSERISQLINVLITRLPQTTTSRRENQRNPATRRAR